MSDAGRPGYQDPARLRAPLADLHELSATTHLRDIFASDPGRGERLVLEAEGLRLDYSKNRVSDEILGRLAELARDSGVETRRDAMFAGEHINSTEDRAVLHVALRMPRERSLIVDGTDVVAEVHATLDRMAAFASKVRAREWLGHTGKPVTAIVNIGIGGSDLGPVMADRALRHYADRGLVDALRLPTSTGTDFAEKTVDLDPETTLFVVASKTFTTLETMTNAHTARDWSLAGLGGDEGRGRQALRRALDERRGGLEVRHRHGQHVRLLGLGRRPLLDGPRRSA